jgi:hypothetical protein
VGGLEGGRGTRGAEPAPLTGEAIPGEGRPRGPPCDTLSWARSRVGVGGLVTLSVVKQMSHMFK